MELFLLREEGADASPQQWIRFPKQSGSEKILGRASDSSIRLLSTTISRSHASLFQDERGRFCIKDLKSLHGIHVNNKKIAADTWFPLTKGDRVEIGRPNCDEILKTMDISDRFIYIVKSSDSSELDHKRVGPRQHLAASVKKIKQSKPTKQNIHVESVKDVPLVVQERKKDHSTVTSEKKNVLPDEKGDPNLRITSVVEDQNKVATVAKIFPVKILADSHKRSLLDHPETPENDPMIQENKRLKLELERREQELLNEREERERKLKEEQSKIVQEMEKNFKNRLEQKEEELEMRLQLEKDIAIEQCKTTVPQTSEPAQGMEGVVNAMENELQCSVCSELFIVATTLNCAHTFCQYCITEWRKVKSECPVCRHPIETITRSLVLDNYIDKVMQSLSKEMQENRSKIIIDRKKVVEEQERQNQGSGSRRRGRGRAVSRGRGRRRHVQAAPPPAPVRRQTRSTPIVIISDLDSSSSNSSFTDSDPHEYRHHSHHRDHMGFIDSDSSGSSDDGYYVLY